MTGCPATSLITATGQKSLLTKVGEEKAYEAMKRSQPARIRDAWVGGMVQGAFEYWALAQMGRGAGCSGRSKPPP